MNILFIAAEVAPFVTVGGLSQVMEFLSRSLGKRGHDVRIFTPRYGSMDEKVLVKKKWKRQEESWRLSIPTDAPPGGPEPTELIANVHSFRSDGHGWTYFLENREYYELRANVFGYADDHVRFALMAKGCLEWLLQLHEAAEKGDKEAWWPDVIHCHDWHASYFIEYARRDPRYREMLETTPIVLTVHNFHYQGNKDFRYLPPEQKDDGSAPLAPLLDKSLQLQNALKRGLLHADAITTVSPTHAREVLTPEYAAGLDDTLQAVRGKLSGILNGIDTEVFNPSSDPIIKERYSRWRFSAARAANKKELQKEFSLPLNENAILFAYIGRLAQQKGVDLICEALPQLFAERKDVQFIVIGGGDDRYRKNLEDFKAAYPDRVGLYLMTDFRLSRKFFAGADAVLIPSQFEPGGLVALEAMRYGAVPIVRRTGGLNDSVTDFDPATGKGNGFSFNGKSPWSLYAATVEALTVHRQPSLWKRLIENCLIADFSWDHVADDYEDWYRRAADERANVRGGGKKKRRRLL